MAASDITSVAGTIQKYFEDSWMDMPVRDFETPLANSALLEKATIPAHKGTYAEFRTFDHFDVEKVSASDDTPKTYSENDEPSTGLDLNGEVKQVSFEFIAAFSELGNVAGATDPVNLLSKTKDEFKTLVARTIHQLTNGRAVKPIVANVLNASQSPTPLPAPFGTIFPAVDNFAALTSGNVITTGTIKRAVAILRNSGAPGAFGDLYACLIDNALLTQLSDDESFLDVVKRHQDMSQKALAAGDMIDWQGVRFIKQNDEYRCDLAAKGGVLTTRKNSGKVHVATILGKGAMGYVDFGGTSGEGAVQRRSLMPKFKVQDLSKTGTSLTIGWRMPYQACVLNNKRGINIAACSNYDETIEDLVG